MPRPGTQIDIVDEGSPGGPNLNTGQAFMVGVAERGPAGYAELASMKQYRDTFGARTGGSLMYDAAGAFFQEGGGVLFVSRIVGPNAVSATVAFGTLSASASSAGTWANDVSLTAEAPSTRSEQLRSGRAAGDPVVVVVAEAGAPVERSWPVASADDLVAWASEHSTRVRFTKGADNVVPAAGTTATLTGGTDDNVVDAESIAAGLDAFTYALGPGQVLAPGLTSDDAWSAVLAHCDTARRCALLDLPDTADSTVLATKVQNHDNEAGIRFAAALGPWAVYPAETAPATVVIPYSGVQAGLIARADAVGNPNEPAAGINGVSRLALGLSQDYSDDDREALNSEGVTLAKVVYGDVRTYGGRTAAGPDDTNWLWFGNSRTIMAIAHEADAVAENYVLRQIDGRRQLFAAFEADLRGMLLPYFDAGALFGDTPADAFSVDTGPQINTIDTIKNGEVHAVIRVKCSPTAEWVQIDVVKVPVERPVAA
jgi:hypothetical protein